MKYQLLLFLLIVKTYINVTDLFIQIVFKHIDGESRVAHISEKSGINIEIVKESLRHLIFFDINFSFPIFIYQSIFQLFGWMNNLFE